MRRATKTTAAWLGLAAGVAGLEHGYFEILQGDTRPDGMMIASIGPPCIPTEAWNACEPALTIIPNLFLSGAISVTLGLAILVWSAGFLQRAHAGIVLMLLSMALLLFGGGIFPPLIGVIGGAVATQIHRPVTRDPGQITRMGAGLWPWPLAALITWLLAQFAVGYFFNDALRDAMGIAMFVILMLLPLAVYSGYARDVVVLSRIRQSP